MTNGTHQLNLLTDEIRAADAVVVVGAGFSFEAGMPLSGQLAPLVWHTLDSHPHVLRCACDSLGVPSGRAKEVIGFDWEKLQVGFSTIGSAADARRTFQHGFARLDRERSQASSVAHVALARLIHRGLAIQIISLNWDTLLETAFEQRYGIDVNANATKLWKPHGDCRHPDDQWTLPDQPGTISDELVRRMTAIAAERPRILLIVGYSERDDMVVQRLISPLARGWRVFRVGPNAAGEGAIRAPATEVIEFVANRLVSKPEFPGWEFVSFRGQRGIEAAISGESLGPKDTETCPRLPYFNSMRTALDLLHTVEIAGGSGCGKSITAWQLAAELNREGWEVLRPVTGSPVSDIESESVIASSPWKRVLVIDDTQKYPEGFWNRLTENASDRLTVIRATTDFQGENASVFRLPAKVAVSALADEMRRRGAEILPIVQRYDPQVGDRYLDLPLERRIRDAEAVSTPWQFAYVLRGGWSQAKRAIDNLRDFNRADRLLFCIAVRQILSLDAGCPLEQVSQGVATMGGDSDSVPNELEFLRSHAAILSGTPIRCPHIQSAIVAMRRFLTDRRDPLFLAAVSYLRTACIDAQSPLRGVSWLLSELYLTDSLWGIELLTEQDISSLVERCCRAATSIDRRDAAFLLTTLLRPRGFVVKALAHYQDILQSWLEHAEAVNAYALGSLINDLYNADKPGMQQLVASTDPERIAGRLAGASTKDGYVWGYFLDRLSLGGEQWRTRMKTVLPVDQIRAMAPLFSSSEIGQLDGYLHGISAIDQELATECLKAAVPALQGAFQANSVESYADIRQIRWSLLGQHPFGDRAPSKAQRRLSKTITDAISAERMLGGIYSCRFGDWERYADLLFWLRNVNPAKHEAVVASVDWGKLDTSVGDRWAQPPRELRLLLASLALRPDGTPVGPWIAAHADRISEVDPIIAGISPEAAIAVVLKGGILNLAGHNGSDWRQQAAALWRIGKLERAVALSALESNKARIGHSLSNLGIMDCEQLPTLLKFLKEFSPEFLPDLFQAVRAEAASTTWLLALTNDRRQVREGARQVFRFAQTYATGELKDLAGKLLSLKPHRKRRLKKKE